LDGNLDLGHRRVASMFTLALAPPTVPNVSSLGIISSVRWQRSFLAVA